MSLDRSKGWTPGRSLPVLLAVAALLVTPACNRRGKAEPAALRPQFTSIGVNSWLWRASLSTMKFMPLQTVDSAGGVIVSDWYQNPNAPNERVKVTILILDSALRADALQVSAQRQVLQGGQWVAAPVRAGTVQRLEEIILERARNLRQAAIVDQ
ncbi:DUF3576 domain-containing protein [Thermaurantiacus sp.]